MDASHDSLTSALAKHRLVELILWWTPGHVGIPGNEEADKDVKEAARNSYPKPYVKREDARGDSQGASQLRSSKLLEEVWDQMLNRGPARGLGAMAGRENYAFSPFEPCSRVGRTTDIRSLSLARTRRLSGRT